MDQWNYFSYFTEIEEYFCKKRGSHLLVSPLDWAIMETWQKAGVPLEAVFKGIDSAFESYGRSRRGAGKPLKSLAYCTDAVLDAAGEAREHLFQPRASRRMQEFPQQAVAAGQNDSAAAAPVPRGHIVELADAFESVHV